MSIDKNFPKNKEELFNGFENYLKEETGLGSATFNGYLEELKKSLVDYKIEEINHENISDLRKKFKEYRKGTGQKVQWKQGEEINFLIKQKKISSLLPYSNGSFSASLPHFIDYLKFENTSLNDFPTFLDNFDISKYEKEDAKLQEEFYEKFPIFDSVNINNWDDMEADNSFIVYLERRTGFIGSGHLGTLKNRLFYYIKDENKNGYGEFDCIDSYKNKFPGETIETIFNRFYDECNRLIETNIEDIDNFELNMLNGANVITTKIYNLYSKTPTLGLSSLTYAKETNNNLGNISNGKSPLKIAYDIEKYLRGAYEKLENCTNIEITRVLSEYNSYIRTNINNGESVGNKVEISAIQKIYAGAPGTGKSFKIENEILSGIDKENNVSRVTFYPDYEYHNFVGSILPVVDNGKVTYEFVKGPFTDILIKALKDKNNHYYLVIEEMTRGNCAAIFGDLFQLLDRNSKEDEANEKGIYGQSKYPINNLQLNKIIKENVEGYKSNKVYLPANLSIIGTINTSDQNVFTMDTAFKRRFQFEYLTMEDNKDKIKDNIKFLDKPWKDFYIKLNNYLLKNLEVTEDKQLGPFFINSSDDNVKVIMYLWQDVIGMYNTHSKLFNSNINTLGDALKVDSIKKLFSQDFLTSIGEKG